MDQLNPPIEGSSTSPSEFELAEPLPDSFRPATLVSSHPPPPPRLRARANEGRPIELPEGSTPRLARDLMTRQLFTVDRDDLIEHLEEQMERYRFRHLPVVEGSRLVGLITRSDLWHLSSSVLSTSAPEENAILHRLTAERVMTRECVTVPPDEPLASVAKLIWDTRVGCVPVVEQDGTLVGILTEGDFVRLARHLLTRPEGARPEQARPEQAMLEEALFEGALLEGALLEETH
jgi:CBS domain-containing protein